MARKASSMLAEKAWPIANLVMVGICLILLLLFFSGGDKRSRKAMQEGQQILINLGDGRIAGYVMQTLPEEEMRAEAAVDSTVPPRRGGIPERSGLAARPEALPEEPVIEQGAAADLRNTEPTETVVTSEAVRPHAKIPPVDVKELQPPEGAEAITENETAMAEEDYPPVVLPPPQDVLEERQAEAEAAEAVEEQEQQPDQPGSLDIPATAGKPLRHAPQPELSEKTADGILPKIGADGSRPWEVYSKLDRYRRPDRPLISIIVTGLGLGRYTTEAAYKLPEHFTLSFSPYARKIDMWASHARNIGHEVLLDLPMQTTDFPATDPGPYGLLNIKDVAENRTRMEWLMKRFPGAMGFVAPYDAQPPDAVMLSALVDIGGRGLLLVDVEGAAAERMDGKKSEMGLIDLTASEVIDLSLSETAIKQQLAALEDKARKEGFAIGIARPYPVTLKQLQSWHQALQSKDMELAPLSAIAQLED